MIWGGDTECQHQWEGQGLVSDTRRSEVLAGKSRTEERSYGGDPTRKFDGQHQKHYQENVCSLCGAWKGQFGLEPTPELYVQHTVEILREIRRVLRKDGVVFWNIGDSYYANSLSNRNFIDNGGRKGNNSNILKPQSNTLKPKDLCLIPFRVAIAAQEDGWYVRSVIIWNKPNPMPESVRDRPTNAYEFILMLTKSGKYYWDADAVREKYSPTVRWGGDKYKGAVKQYSNNEDAGLARERSCYPNTGRNLRDVWTFPTSPFPSQYVEGEKLDHFAVFPEKLPELCIKAASSEKGCCPKCGAPWARVVEKTGHINTREPAHVPGNTPTKVDSTGWAPTMRTTDKWQPTCKCGLDPIPCTVLDPFAGSGTTLLVASKLGRKSIGYELSEDYCKMTVSRNRQGAL